MNSLLTVLSLDPGHVTKGTDVARIVASTIDQARVGIKDGDVIVIDATLVAVSQSGVQTGVSAEDFARAVHTHSLTPVAARTYGYPPSTMRLVRTPHNTVELNAGLHIDKGNLILPVNSPDDTAAHLHEQLRREYGVRLGLILSTTLPHPYRQGQRPASLAHVGIETQKRADEIACAAALTDIEHKCAVVRGTDAGLTDTPPAKDPLGPFASWFHHGSAESVYIALGIDPDKTPAPSGDDSDDVLTKVTRAITAVRLGPARTPGENAWRIRPAGAGSWIEIEPAHIDLTSHAGGHPLMEATVGLGGLVERLTTALAVEGLRASATYSWGAKGTSEGAQVDVYA